MSIATSKAAESRRAAAATDYNLKLGQGSWRFNAGAGLIYQDNINYTAEDPESDFIFRPSVNSWLWWPISDQNTIKLSMGAGYLLYFQHSELDRLYIDLAIERISSCKRA